MWNKQDAEFKLYDATDEATFLYEWCLHEPLATQLPHHAWCNIIFSKDTICQVISDCARMLSQSRTANICIPQCWAATYSSSDNKHPIGRMHTWIYFAALTKPSIPQCSVVRRLLLYLRQDVWNQQDSELKRYEATDEPTFLYEWCLHEPLARQFPHHAPRNSILSKETKCQIM